MMTLEQIRLRQNPVLTNILLGLGQGTLVAEKLLPRLPQALSGVTIPKLGDERLKRYNLRRAPGAVTKRVDISYDGVVYKVEQYSVEVPMPRELLREADEARKLNVSAYLDVSQIAMTTANDILLLDYEIEAAAIATTAASYASGHTLALSGGTKWSASTGTPVTDVSAASNVIRKKIGKRPNTLLLSADADTAVRQNPQVKSYLPSTQQGPATDEQLKSVFKVSEILVADAVWKDGTGTGQDVWGNNAILAYVPKVSAGANGSISLAEPALGFTSVLPGHPFAETPYFENGSKSWIYGATYERQANLAYEAAGFLFTNPN
ncbi:hypothetical protein BRI6_1098 [plant metagenome]|uniref:Phage protein n=1 Tax=plant metagenome TaxID=1297885 RepID=A0A484TF70_9ZZZZ